ncbi:hypothetical protein KACHI17_10260 [Sediminibacterium sp. KACHI17]|uniref:Uncharacterized protein n=1 Tax=Sediminibacterium sp. KACHI17 TaxID=1751071 RepID=A0AAT9GI28_9BACT
MHVSDNIAGWSKSQCLKYGTLVKIVIILDNMRGSNIINMCLVDKYLKLKKCVTHVIKNVGTGHNSF